MTADSGGTGTTPTPVPHDSGDAAATAVSKFYTANPTVGGTPAMPNIRSSMTNANVDTVVVGSSGRELKLSYKGGTNTVTVPDNAPVVTFAPATRADLVARSG